MESQDHCPERERLASIVQDILAEMTTLNHDLSDALKRDDQTEASAIDRRIENLLGEKERALGALKQHRAEHAC